jgi:hypothetical protein
MVAAVLHPVAERSRKWTSLHARWMVFQLGMLFALFAVLCLVRYEDTRMLWSTMLGIKMLIQTAVLLSLGFLISYIACRLMDRVRPEWHQEHPVWGVVGAVGLLSIQFVWLFIPAVFVLITGPAAVQIVQNLTNS